MARIKKKGEAGAAKAYMTRSAAVKKLQCSLADFRRLCILKGIFPREPRNKKKANKGSSAPTTFYYAKDIAYLAHEPVLKKLREHKAFAKRFARALGRGEWSSAKSLEESKPVYRIDHIIKERYPSFIDALRDIDDALCMIFLFASLPAGHRIPPSIIENCARLAAEWQLYVMKSKSLRKAFLSIKGIYYQADVMGETVTWLVPYLFMQIIPVDVDVRVMVTFLELYQTLMGFVLFRLYLEIGASYPPLLDIEREQEAAGLGAFTIKEISAPTTESENHQVLTTPNGKKITGRDVREAIRKVVLEPERPELYESSPVVAVEPVGEEEFVPQISTHTHPAELPTLKSLTASSNTTISPIFDKITFFLSRETPRGPFEFMVRCFGGKIGWHASQGKGSPYDEDDENITHVIIDRPVTEPSQTETEEQRLRRLRRKFVQPQWVVDCINAGKILSEVSYAQGKPLPPHISPFGEGSSTYVPVAEGLQDGRQGVDLGSEEETVDHEVPDRLDEIIGDPDMLRAAEIRAEMEGMDAKTFNQRVEKAAKRKRLTVQVTEEKDMNKMMMTNKQRKLYNKLKFTEKKRAEERSMLEQRRQAIKKALKGKSGLP